MLFPEHLLAARCSLHQPRKRRESLSQYWGAEVKVSKGQIPQTPEPGVAEGSKQPAVEEHKSNPSSGFTALRGAHQLKS